jgi:hypothetical protein
MRDRDGTFAKELIRVFEGGRTSVARTAPWTPDMTAFAQRFVGARTGNVVALPVLDGLSS